MILRTRYSRGKERIGEIRSGMWKLWELRKDLGVAELRADFVSASKNYVAVTSFDFW